MKPTSGRGGAKAAGRPLSTRPSRPGADANLLLTLTKLEKESEGRAFELIKLRTLVLKCEKERGDALAEVAKLTEQNKEIEEALGKARAELSEVKKDQATERVSGWLDSAKGLSTVLAITQVEESPTPDSPSKPAPVKSFHDGDAGMQAARLNVMKGMDGSNLMESLEAELASYKLRVEHAERELQHALAANEELSVQVSELDKGSKAVSGPLGGKGSASAGASPAHKLSHMLSGGGGSSRGRDLVRVPPPTKLTEVKALQEYIAKLVDDNDHTLQLKHVEIDHLRYQAEQMGKEKREAEEKLQLEIDALSTELAKHMAPQAVADLRAKSTTAPASLPKPSAGFSSSFTGKRAPEEGASSVAAASTSGSSSPEIAELKAAVAKYQSELEHVTAERDIVAAQLLTADQTRSKGAAGRPVNSSNTGPSPSVQYEAEVSRLRRQLTEATAELETVRKRAEASEDRVAAMNAELEDANRAAEASARAARASAASVAEMMALVEAGTKRGATSQVAQVGQSLELASNKERESISKLETQLADVRRELESACTSNKDLTAKLEEAQGQLRSSEQSCKELQSRLDSTTAQSSSMSKQVADAEAALAAANDKLSKSEVAHAQLQKDLEVLRTGNASSVSRLQSELSAAKESAAKWQAELASGSARVAELTAELTKVKASEEAEKKRATQVEADLTQERGRLAAAASKLDAQVAKVKSDLEAKVKSLEAELAKVKEEGAKAKSKVELGAKEAAKLAAELASLQAISDKKNVESAALEETWKAEKAVLESHTEAEKAETNRLRKELHDAIAAQQSATEASEQLQLALDAELAAHKDSKDKLQAASASLLTTQGELTNTQSALETVESNLIALKEKLEEAVSNLTASHSQQLTILKAEHESAVQNLRKTHDGELKKVHKEAEESIKTLQSKHKTELQAMLADQKAGIESKAKAIKAKWDAASKASTASAEATAAELQKLKAANTKLESELASTQKELAKKKAACEAAVKREAELSAEFAKLSDVATLVAGMKQLREEAEADAKSQRHECNTLRDHNQRMQTLMKTMAGQMESLQSSLNIQTEMVAKLQSAVENAQEQERSLTARLADAERRLTAARMKASKQQKEATRQAAASAAPPNFFSTKAEVDGLFRRLKGVCSMYRLNMGPLLGGKMKDDSYGTATDLQLLQAIHGMLAALETFGSAVSSAGGIASLTNSSSSRATTLHGYTDSHLSSPTGEDPRRPRPSSGNRFARNTSSDTRESYNGGGGGGVLLRLPSSNGGNPHVAAHLPRISSSSLLPLAELDGGEGSAAHGDLASSVDNFPSAFPSRGGSQRPSEVGDHVSGSQLPTLGPRASIDGKGLGSAVRRVSNASGTILAA